MRIGIIDSGMGGLAVTKLIKNPMDQYIILLDRAYFPYGTKSKEFLLKRAYYLVEYLKQQQVDLIVLACNTLSIVALSFLKSCFTIKILGVFDFFLPFLKKENAIIGSKYTIDYVRKNFPIYCIDGTNLIEAIEKKQDYQFWIKNIAFPPSQFLLLACTHFLALNKEAFPIPTMNQIEFLKEEIKKARNES